MSRHFEILRTDAEQPWTARLIVNADITWRTENLTRKVGAERSILSLAKTFGWVDPKLVKHSDTESYILDARPDGPNAVTVKYLDLRDPNRCECGHPWVKHGTRSGGCLTWLGDEGYCGCDNQRTEGNATNGDRVVVIDGFGGEVVVVDG